MKRLLAAFTALVVFEFTIPAYAVETGDVGCFRDKCCNAMVGEPIRCHCAVTMPMNGEGTFSCFLSRGLSFVSVISVERNGEPINAAYYTIVTSRQGSAAFSLHISTLAAEPGEQLSVEYILMLNDEAEEFNTFSLHSPEEQGNPGCIRMFSLCALRSVIISSSGHLNPVSGACLCLSRDEDGRNRVAFRQRGEDTYLACTADGCRHARHLYVLKTPRSGRVYLEGLSAGTYYLCETRPAEGVMETAEPVKLTVTEEGKLYQDGTFCPDNTAVLSHVAGEAAVDRGFSLLDFYHRGTQVLAMAFLALLATRRYYL